MSTKIGTETANWEKLRTALLQEAGNMEQAAGEKIVEIKLPSDYDMTLVHKKTFKGLSLTFIEGMDSLRVENSAGAVNLTKIPDFCRLVGCGLVASIVLVPSRLEHTCVRTAWNGRSSRITSPRCGRCLR